jgi:hypothetical protein
MSPAALVRLGALVLGVFVVWRVVGVPVAGRPVTGDLLIRDLEPARKVVSECRGPAPTIVGAAIILGANTGPGPEGVDPAWTQLSRSPHLKVFVEPIPTIFDALVRNLRTVRNHVAINAAIRTSGGSPNLTMYCIGDPTDLNNLGAHNYSWLSGTCSTVRSRLFHGYDMAHRASRAEIASKIREFTVRALTIDRLLEVARVPLDQIAYVQTDVEGLDDQVVLALPFSDRRFRPRTVVWEHVLFGDAVTTRVNGFLEAHSYTICRRAQNMVATRRRPGPDPTTAAAVRVVEDRQL